MVKMDQLVETYSECPLDIFLHNSAQKTHLSPIL